MATGANFAGREIFAFFAKNRLRGQAICSIGGALYGKKEPPHVRFCYWFRVSRGNRGTRRRGGFPLESRVHVQGRIGENAERVDHFQILSKENSIPGGEDRLQHES